MGHMNFRDIKSRPRMNDTIHESVFRAYHILDFVVDELQRIEHPHVRLILEVVDELQTAPDVGGGQ